MVGADASGSVTAPTFTANGVAGSYTVTANSQYGSISFSLTNTAAGVPAKLTVIPLKRRSARVGDRFPRPLQVRVLDAEGNPVAGATITFTLGSASPSRCGTTAASGFAISPAFTANTAAGSFTATASISSGGGSESAGKAVESSVASVSFSLVNLAGKPARIAPSVGSTQSTPAGAAFPIPLAVTVTDAEENPVPDALVTFSAPATG